nr:hypothetical protein [Tanacetum cinerariifolium]
PPATSHVAASYWTAASDVAATSAPVNAAGHRSTVADHYGDRRSTTVAGGKPPLTATGPPLTTTGPPVNGGWWAGQSWVRAGSGSGLPRVSHVCPRGIHVDADVDNMQRVGIDPGTLRLES